MKVVQDADRAAQIARIKAMRSQAEGGSSEAAPVAADQVEVGRAAVARRENADISKTASANKTHRTGWGAYATFAAMATGAALLGGTALAGVAAATGVVGTLACAAGVGASLVAGYAGADLLSGFIHFGLDNYPNSNTPLVGKVADDFQYHHHNPHSVFRRTFLENCHLTGRFAGPAALAAGLTVGSPFLAAGALAFTAGAYLLQGSHMLAHDTRPTRLNKVLQKLHITQSRKNHNAHHTRPWESNYTIVNGMCNPLLEKVHFWRKLEKAIYQVSGRESKAWRHLPTRDFALGKIDAAQYRASFKDGMADFQTKADAFLEGYLQRNPDRDRNSGRDV